MCDAGDPEYVGGANEHQVKVEFWEFRNRLPVSRFITHQSLLLNCACYPTVNVF